MMNSFYIKSTKSCLKNFTILKWKKKSTFKNGEGSYFILKKDFLKKTF